MTITQQAQKFVVLRILRDGDGEGEGECECEACSSAVRGDITIKRLVMKMKEEHVPIGR